MRSVLVLFCSVALVVSCSTALLGEPVTIGGVTYDQVDPGEPFKEAPRSGQHWDAPKPFRAERRAGTMAFVTPDPGDYKPDRNPRPEWRRISPDCSGWVGG